ncbi:MAG: hypothetical protein M3440_16095, partial [Chloroflexota bacterium]|nr:hypothetical protein [Chloroflexota bacterium]
MLNATFRQIFTQRTRLFAVTLALAISMAFLTAALLFGPILNSSFRNRVGAEYQHVDLVVSAVDAPLSDAAISQVSGIDGVAGVEPRSTIYIDASGRGSSVY